MSKQIRKASIEDAIAFIDIKSTLSFKHVNGSTTTGGFLLGTDLNTYHHYIREASCLVAEVNNNIVGFGILFNDELLRNSSIWKRRSTANWLVDLQHYEKQVLCYFEQLAFLPGHRSLVLSLAYKLVNEMFMTGAQTLVTTTVREPIVNLAAIPFIRAVNGIHAGLIDEEYAFIGHIKSDIYFIERKKFYDQTRRHPLMPRIASNLIN